MTAPGDPRLWDLSDRSIFLASTSTPWSDLVQNPNAGIGRQIKTPSKFTPASAPIRFIPSEARSVRINSVVS